jgi:hypothetical protein
MPMQIAFLEAACDCPVTTCANCGMRPTRRWTIEELFALRANTKAGDVLMQTLCQEAEDYILGLKKDRG